MVRVPALEELDVEQCVVRKRAFQSNNVVQRVLLHNTGWVTDIINAEPAIPGINCLGFQQYGTKILCQGSAQLIDLVMLGRNDYLAVY